MQPRRTLCLCGACSLRLFHHREAEYAEVLHREISSGYPGFAATRYRQVVLT